MFLKGGEKYMNNIEVNQNIDFRELDDDANRVNNWLGMFGNQNRLHYKQDLENPKFKDLVQTVNADPIFRAFDGIFLRDMALDPYAIGHNGLEKAHNEKYRKFAETIYGARWWVKALKTFRMQETPEEQLTRKERKQFLTEPFADQALAGAIQAKPCEVDKLTLGAQNFLWVLFVMGQRELAKKIANDPILFEKADIREAFEEVNKLDERWEKLRGEWTVLALGIKPDQLPYGNYHTFGELTKAWRVEDLKLEGEHQLQWTNGEDQKQMVWARRWIYDEDLGKVKNAPWFDKLEKLKEIIKP